MNVRQTMKAYIYSEPGGPEVLKQVDRQVPVPAADEVLLKVVAFGLNRADVQQRNGVYPPPPGASDIPGLEVSGTIEALGENVTGWKNGDRVAALLASGGYAQYVAVPQELLFAVPDAMKLTDAAGLPEVSSTVVSNIFDQGELETGQTILIQGGAGGIGSMAIQLAKAAGARVLVTASSQEKLDYCAALGADEGINYTETDVLEKVKELTNDQGVDLILDVVGAKYLSMNLKALRTGGRLVIIGLQGGRKAEVDLGLMLGKRLRIIATTLRARPLAEKAGIVQRTVERIAPLLERGELELSVGKVFDFESLTEAHEYFDSGSHKGKIVIEIQ